MGKRTNYEPGTFSWVELHTPEPDSAKSFYGAVFGWEADDVPIPEEAGGGVYTLLKLRGETVAALFDQPQDQRDMGIPPNWFNYVTVTDAGEAAARAKALGGTIQADAFDVMEDGRMSVISDPTGAFLGCWEPRNTIGATLVNDPGCLTFNELSTNDVPRAIEFYEGLFGWNVEEIDTGDAPPYWGILHEGAAEGRNGGMRELTPEQAEAGVPPHWLPYFTVESADDTGTTTTDAGGSVVVAPFDIPIGARIGVLQDPQGAFFAIFEGRVDQ